jgi:hypothetical protein
MNGQQKRLSDLEKGAAVEAKDWVTVYEMDGIYWQVGSPGMGNYRAVLDPDYPGNQKLTDEDLARLRSRHNILMVRYEDQEKPGI